MVSDTDESKPDRMSVKTASNSKSSKGQILINFNKRGNPFMMKQLLNDQRPI